MSEDITFTGLSKTDAEQCLDFLHTQGYTECRADLCGGTWAVTARTPGQPEPMAWPAPPIFALPWRAKSRERLPLR
jgi:hypothetical protein